MTSSSSRRRPGKSVVARSASTVSSAPRSWNAKHLQVIAVIELVGTLFYAVPRTAALGAVLLTGLLRGAVATHLRIENPLFSHTVFPLYVGSFIWGGLWLRNAQVRALLPLLVGNKRAPLLGLVARENLGFGAT